MVAMRLVVAGSLLAALAAPVRADTFGGFSGVDRPYLVNQDKVCTPVPVVGGSAKGAPTCQKAGADVVARLSIKDPVPQRGDKAAFGATAASRTLSVTSKTGGVIITWEAVDPIGKVVEVYASQYEDRVAVSYTTRRMGKEVTDVIAFDLGKPSVARTPDVPTPGTTPGTTPMPTAAPEDPAVAKAVAAARKAAKPKALAAWTKVLALDAAHAEAHYQVAVAHALAKANAKAIDELTGLAGSSRADAIEWLIEARFDAAFAGVRADPAFRKAVGFDRAPLTTYERLMGFGGQWEQTGTSCDKAEVRFTVTRDRVARVRVITRCQGHNMNLPFKGTWRLTGDKVVLTFATRGKQVTAEDEAGCVFERTGDEDSLRCTLGRDLDFVVLPTRR